MGRPAKPKAEKAISTSIAILPADLEFIRELAIEEWGRGQARVMRDREALKTYMLTERPSVSGAFRFLLDQERLARESGRQRVLQRQPDGRIAELLINPGKKKRRKS
jgi:hypothetical protein